ncbi:hypothetical protein LPN01_18425 [Sphingomonas sp. A2-49]|nr:hypothetical protein [Sphingomonas sp. A2-49]MCU6456058.1 hypothetical protein [Sphingomonas sp. A2-49]
MSRPVGPDNPAHAIGEDSDLFADDLTTLACPLDPSRDDTVAGNPKAA